MRHYILAEPRRRGEYHLLAALPQKVCQKVDRATRFPRPLLETPGGCINFLKERKQSTERLAVPKVQPTKQSPEGVVVTWPTTMTAIPYHRGPVHGKCSPTMKKEERQKALKQRKQSTERLAVPKVQPAKHLSDLSPQPARSPPSLQGPLQEERLNLGLMLPKL